MEILKSMIDPKIVMAIVISFIVASILGPIIIPLLHKLKFGQNIRQEGPKSHLKSRNSNYRWINIYFCNYYNNVYYGWKSNR